MARAVTMTGREESEIAMRETTDSPGGPGMGETVPTLGDPTALPGLETAAQGLFNYCPSTLLGAKAIQAVRGDGAPRLHEGGDREQQLRAITKLGYGIALVGLF